MVFGHTVGAFCFCPCSVVLALDGKRKGRILKRTLKQRFAQDKLERFVAMYGAANGGVEREEREARRGRKRRRGFG